MREKLVCQKETARKKLPMSAITVEVLEFWNVRVLNENNSLVNRYRPRTVRIPITAETALKDQAEISKIEKDEKTKLIKRPSLP